jgi:hypothetical protein
MKIKIIFMCELKLRNFVFAVTSLQQGWAETKKVTVISSAYSRPELGYTGSGRFSERAYAVGISLTSGGFSLGVLSNSTGFYNQEKSDSLNTKEVILESQDLSDWSSSPVPFSNVPNTVKVCHGETFCCILNYRMIRSGDNPNFQVIDISYELRNNCMYIIALS